MKRTKELVEQRELEKKVREKKTLKRAKRKITS